MASGQSNPSKRRRRWLQFSLRTMLLVTLVVALLLGWLAEKIDTAWQQQRTAEAILKLGGYVAYDYQFDARGKTVLRLPRPEPPGPKWLRWLLGEHFFARAVTVTYPPGITDKDLEHLANLPYLTEIHLRGGTVTAAGLDHVWKHDKLRRLTLRSVPAGDAAVANLATFRQLEDLDLSHTPITDAAVETLSRLPSLSYLRLEGTHVSPEAARPLERPLPNYGDEVTWGAAPSEAERQVAAALERDGARVEVYRQIHGREPEYHVSLHGESMDGKTLGLLERLESLKNLVLSYMSIEDGRWAQIAGSDASSSEDAERPGLPSGRAKGLTHLEGLGVHGVPLTDKQMRHIGGLVNLEGLRLHDTQVTGAGLIHLASLPRLRILALSGGQFGDEGLVHLAGLGKLKCLSIDSPNITDAGLVHIAKLTNLSELWLSEVQITDAGLAHLAALEHLTSLTIDSTWLTIDSPDVTDAGLLQLVQLPSGNPNLTDAGLVHIAKLTNLSKLWLYGVQMSDAGLAHLAALEHLTSLVVDGPNVTDAGLPHIAKLTNLSELRLYEARQISEAGLDVLRKLPRLQSCSVNGVDVLEPTDELLAVPVRE